LRATARRSRTLATLEVRTPWRVARVRLDGMFADWGGAVESGPVASVTLNAVATPFPKASVAPYLLAGAGGYRPSGSVIQSGWTVGAGLRLGGARAVSLETRLHSYVQPNSERKNFFERVGYFPDKWVEMWAPIAVAVQF
jgi:hypothetical protein